MSRHRTRSPLHSRPSPLLGRRDGYYGEQYHAPVCSDLWRGSENVDNRNAEGGVRWDNGSSQAEEQVDHWAKFIEAIGHAENRSALSVSRYHAQAGVQRFEEDSARSQRCLSDERLASTEGSQYGMEMHQKIQPPGQRRNEYDGPHEDRRYSRSSSPKHSQGKRHSRMEHGYHNEENEDRYERSSYSERSLKSNYTQNQLHFKGCQDLDPQEEYTVSRRDFTPHCTPLIVEHGHGITKHDARIHNPGRDRERPRSRDPTREQGHPRSHDPTREQGHPRSHDPNRDRDHPRSRDPVRDQEQPRSSGSVRDREYPMSRDPVSQQEHPRSHDTGRDRERPRGGSPVRHQEHPRSRGPIRTQEHPRSRGPIRTQEHPRSHDSLRTSDLPRDYSKRDYPKSSEAQRRDPIRGRESSRSKELRKTGRDYNHHPGTSHDGPRGSANYPIREDTRFHTSSAGRGSPLRGMQHHKEQLRMEPHSRNPHGQRSVQDEDLRMDESSSSRASVPDWEEEMQPRGNHGGLLGQGNSLKRNPQHTKPNHPGARMDFAGHETLKIKVDMSRPVHQSSHAGYSSERQLSLDLVNVGRQRLDFLPMLEHSGTFRETAMHSGTFAQEIITLVHQVKENYFQGQSITLNERFSNEQEYSLVDDSEEEQEMEGIKPIINRPLGSSDTQIFCKIGPMQSQKKSHVPAPGDLRYDLERKRQERLEGVKITIAGGNFSQILAQSPESGSAYMGDEDLREEGWSEEREQTKHWDEPPQKRSRRNYNRVRNRLGRRLKRDNNKGARW